mgnify:CR=1 FL=1
MGDFVDLAGLKSLGAFDYFELHFIALGKGPETRTFDGAVMNEYVFTVILLDESESFGLVEPFHLTFQNQFLRK